MQIEELHRVLLADGPSDAVLIDVLTWLLESMSLTKTIRFEFADLSRLERRPANLRERIVGALRLDRCDCLFVHRDAEGESRETRIMEIDKAVDEARKRVYVPPVVHVIPVRMTEAWFLFDETALRRAAGNPNGKMRLGLPRLSQVESIADAKAFLKDKIRLASGLSGRRLKSIIYSLDRPAMWLRDYSPLRASRVSSA